MRVFEAMPHIEDEMAFVWEAQVIAEGNLTIDSPPHPKSFLVPFTIDQDGQRFGKYPIGWPALLSFGIRLGLREWVNPILAGLAVWLTYRLGKRLLGETVGLLAAGLTVVSPFFLMNSGSLLSHPFGLVLSAAFALAWLDNFGDSTNPPRWLPTITAGLLLGLFALTRPYTALGVALPFGFHGLYLLARGDKRTRQHILALGGIAVLLGAFHFVWQAALTGDPFINPYTLYWSYDRVGFGEGYGRHGHSLVLAGSNLYKTMRAGAGDLFGWGYFSWLFLPFGFWAIRRNKQAWLNASVFFSTALIHLAYWIGISLFGPRYYYEGLYSLTILTAAGIAWLAGWPIIIGEKWPRREGKKKLRPLMATAVVALLSLGSLIFYIPMRLNNMHGLYSIERSELYHFLTPKAQEITPALIIVHHEHWEDYGGLLELQDAYLETPFIFVISRGTAANQEVADTISATGRAVYHYYPDEPNKFYTNPRPIDY